MLVSGLVAVNRNADAIGITGLYTLSATGTPLNGAVPPTIIAWCIRTYEKVSGGSRPSRHFTSETTETTRVIVSCTPISRTKPGDIKMLDTQHSDAGGLRLENRLTCTHTDRFWCRYPRLLH